MKEHSGIRGFVLHLPDDPAELATALDLALHTDWLAQPCEVLTARVSERRREHRLLAIPGLMKLKGEDPLNRFTVSKIHPDGEHVVVDGQKVRIARREAYASVVQLLPPRPWDAVPQYESIFFLARSRPAFEELVGRALALGQEGMRFEFLQAEGDEAVLLVAPRPGEQLLAEWTNDPQARVAVFYRLPNAPVCIEWGYEHPWAARLRSSGAADSVWLIDGQARWRQLPTAELRDIYDLISIDTTSFSGLTWTALPPGRPFVVPLGLVTCDSPAQPEMWMLPGEGVERLKALLSELPEEALEGLAFCRYRRPDGREQLVLYESAPGKVGPLLEFAPGRFASMRNPVNLMLPVGWRLTPPIRPERLIEVLRIQEGQWVVIHRNEDGTLSLIRLNQADFQPMSSVVRHVLDADRGKLEAIMAGAVFEFDVLEPPPESPPGIGRRIRAMFGH